MLLNTDHMRKLAGVMRVNPPIRQPRHKQALWDALVAGVLDMIAADHAPHTPEETSRADIWECDCGFPGVEPQMPLMPTEIHQGRASLMDEVKWGSVNPATAWSLSGTKGATTVGAHADMAFVDMGLSDTLSQGLQTST
jgi:dihydroorotase